MGRARPTRVRKPATPGLGLQRLRPARPQTGLARTAREFTDDPEDLGAGVDPGELVGHQLGARTIIRPVEHGANRLPQRLRRRSLLARLMPTPDQATRALTAALSSVSPAVTSGIP